MPWYTWTVNSIGIWPSTTGPGLVKAGKRNQTVEVYFSKKVRSLEQGKLCKVTKSLMFCSLVKIFVNSAHNLEHCQLNSFILVGIAWGIQPEYLVWKLSFGCNLSHLLSFEAFNDSMYSLPPCQISNIINQMLSYPIRSWVLELCEVAMNILTEY